MSIELEGYTFANSDKIKTSKDTIFGLRLMTNEFISPDVAVFVNSKNEISKIINIAEEVKREKVVFKIGRFKLIYTNR